MTCYVFRRKDGSTYTKTAAPGGLIPQESPDDRLIDPPFAQMPSGGLKDLADKPMLELVPPEMILAHGEVSTRGAKKYAPRNWEKGIPYMTCVGALLRHLMKWVMGQDIDEETGLHHIDQVLWWAGALSTFRRRGRTDLDDRSSKQTNEDK